MATLCQPNDQGVCIQCRQPRAAGVLFTCPKRAEFRHVKPIAQPRPSAVVPSFVARVRMFCGSVRRWLAAGQPVRSQARVDELLALCGACEQFTGTNCAECGCPINGRVDAPKKNKLAMATEACPLDPPRWTAEAALAKNGE